MSRIVCAVLITLALLLPDPGLSACTLPSFGVDCSQGGVVAAAAPARSDQIWIRDFAFLPEILIIPPGTTVTWTNEDLETHTVRSLDGLFHSDDLDQGQTYAHRFDSAGTFAYTCDFHPSMVGTVIIAPNARRIIFPVFGG